MGNQLSKDAVIQQMLDAHKTYAEICKLAHCSRYRVSMVAHGLPMTHQMGRPEIVTEEMVTFMDINWGINGQITDAHMTEMVKEKWPNVEISVKTIERTRVKLKYDYRPRLTVQVVSEEQRAARLEFVNWVLSQPRDLFDSVVFSDESKFSAEPDNSWVRIKRGHWNETVLMPREKFYASTMVWAAIGKGYQSGLIQCTGKVDQEEYRNILQTSQMFNDCDRIFQPGKWIFMQDGAPCHTADETMKFLSTRCQIMPGWPPNSPDLNPIELLWAIIKRKLKKETYRTADGLQRAATEESE
jgi:hypothetical protein